MHGRWPAPDVPRAQMATLPASSTSRTTRRHSFFTSEAVWPGRFSSWGNPANTQSPGLEPLCHWCHFCRTLAFFEHEAAGDLPPARHGLPSLSTCPLWRHRRAAALRRTGTSVASAVEQQAFHVVTRTGRPRAYWEILSPHFRTAGEAAYGMIQRTNGVGGETTLPLCIETQAENDSRPLKKNRFAHPRSHAKFRPACSSTKLTPLRTPPEPRWRESVSSTCPP